MNEFNEHDEDIERELRAVRPAKLPAELKAKLERALTDDAALTAFPGPTRTTSAQTWFLRGAALAATITLLFSFAALREGAPGPGESSHNIIVAIPDQDHPEQPEQIPEARHFTPVQYANFLMSAQDEGLVNAPGEAPLRRVRYQYYDVCTLEDEERGERIEMIVPREEVLLIRAQIF